MISLNSRKFITLGKLHNDLLASDCVKGTYIVEDVHKNVKQMMEMYSKNSSKISSKEW